MKTKSIVFASLMVLSLAAQAKEGGNNDFTVCKADMERLCSSVKPGDGRLVKCMMENKSRASSGCQAVLAKKEQKEKAWQPHQQSKPNKVKHPQ
jgi:hypothetical protein